MGRTIRGIAWWLVIAIGLAVLASVAQASPQPEACIATQFAYADGRVDPLAGTHLACPQRGRIVKLDPRVFGIAHRTLPCGTKVLLVNIRNGRAVKAVVVDRGPYRALRRTCSRDGHDARWPSYTCWRRGKTLERRSLAGDPVWTFGSCVDLLPPVARAIGLRGMEPVLVYPLPKRWPVWPMHARGRAR